MSAPTTPTSDRWTPEQIRGIQTVGHSLLVSAAAGSGKTAVLAERCAHLVCDAKPACDVDRLLVVTFTRAAASEMRSRIESALRKRLASATAEQETRLTRELALLDRASISTLHAFCMTLLRENFHLLNLDPAFTLIDEDQARLLRHEVVRELFADRYETDESGAFQSLVDHYAQGNDQSLATQVLATHDLLCSVIDPPGWCQQALQRLIEASEGRLGESELGKRLIDGFNMRLAGLKQRAIAAAGELNANADFTPYLEYVNELIATLEKWASIAKTGSIDPLADAIRGFRTELPRTKLPQPLREQAIALIDPVRDEMKSRGALAALCRFTESEWRDGLQRIIEPTRTFLDLCAEFRARFESRKRSLRSLDYADLEQLTLRLLDDRGQPSEVARLCHRRYAHVLVDEYQDINAVQDRILSLLSRDCVAKATAGGNLFCVGDVKQSIYRFRLAQPRQFTDRAGRFGRGKAANGGEIIDLSTNFRSRRRLLEALNGIFERLMIGGPMEINYDASHRLHAPEVSPYDAMPCDAPPITLHLLPDSADANPAAQSQSEDDNREEDEDQDRTDREAAFVARQILELMHGGTLVLDKSAQPPATRPLRFGDIAILLRAKQIKADQFAEKLRAAGIPVHSDSSSGFFAAMEIRDMLALLAVLDNQQQDIPLAAVLRSPLLRLPRPEDLLALARLAHPDPAVPFHAAIVQYAAEKGGPLAEALLTLARWREWTNQLPLADAIQAILADSGYLTFCSGLADGEQRVANLRELHRRAELFEASTQSLGLGRFRHFLETLQNESDLGQPSVAVEGDQAVRVMTIHRSKGLEFPVVFVPDLGKRHNLRSCAGSILVDRDAYVGLLVADEERRVRYPSLAHVMAKETIRIQSLAEEMRVLYVAATRACERLILIGTISNKETQAWQARFASHQGPLPLGHVSAAASPLHWIGPAALALAEQAPDLASVVVHAQPPTTSTSTAANSEDTPLKHRLAMLEPLDPAPPPNERAARILERLQSSYPFEPLTRLPAVRSVSQLASQSHGVFPRKLTGPADAGASKESPSGAEIGDATHIVMEHIDLHRPVDPGNLRAKLEEMVRRRFLTAQAAQSVDLASIEWFLNSELGAFVRRHAPAVRREQALLFAETLHSSAEHPLDRTMVRGRIDLLLPLADRCVLVDYKTDKITPDRIDDQVAHHRPQIELYANAISSLLRMPVEGHLAFLRLHECRQVCGPSA